MEPENPADRPESIPTPLRALAGLAAAALDESRRLPAHLAGLPVLLASTAFEASLKLQQRYAELVARGDELLANLGPLPDGAPPWARFDDEEDVDSDDIADGDGRDTDDLDYAEEWVGEDEGEQDDGRADERADDRLATDTQDDTSSGTPDPVTADADPTRVAESSSGAEDEFDEADTGVSASVPLPGYDDMSIPQLRARLRSLDQARLEALIAHEQRTLGRAAYLTMLSNRLETLRSGGSGRRRA
jgi:hypothetical protein